MRIGIDWVAVVILVVATVISNINFLSLRLRYTILAGALFTICGWRLRMGLAGINLAFVALAALFGIRYVVLALRARH